MSFLQSPFVIARLTGSGIGTRLISGAGANSNPFLIKTGSGVSEHSGWSLQFG